MGKGLLQPLSTVMMFSLCTMELSCKECCDVHHGVA